MARSRYEYSTSPRKLEPEYKPQQKQNKNPLSLTYKSN